MSARSLLAALDYRWRSLSEVCILTSWGRCDGENLDTGADVSPMQAFFCSFQVYRGPLVEMRTRSLTIKA